MANSKLGSLCSLPVLICLPVLPVHAADSIDLLRAGSLSEMTTQADTREVIGRHIAAADAELQHASFVARNESDVRSSVERALADTGRALAISPQNPEALLRKAIALGYLAKLDSDAGRAREARNLMQRVVDARPNHALGWASLGGWHGEAVADLGRLVANSILGATRDKSFDALRRAVRLAPDRAHYSVLLASFLLEIGRSSDQSEAKTLLRRAVRASGNDSIDRKMKSSARSILAAIDSGDEDEALKLARKLRPLGQLP